MKLVLSEKKGKDKFTNWIGLLRTLNEEMTLIFTDEGVTARAMDASHVAMIDTTMKKSAFDEFEVETEVTLTMNLVALFNRLKTLQAKEHISITMSEEEAKLRLNIRDPSTSRRRHFGNSLLEALEEELPDPKLNHAGEVRFLLKDLERAVKDAGFVSEHIKLDLKQKVDGIQEYLPLHFTATGDLGDSHMELEGLNAEVKDEATATYTLEYLDSFVGALKPLADVVTFKFASDMPLEIEVEGTNSSYECKLFLAPCIGV